MEYRPVASSSTIHPASLLPSYVHDPALIDMLSVKVDAHLADYVVDYVVATVQYVLERSWGSSGPYHLKQAPFVTFVHHVLRLSGCPVPTILVALTYLDRAKHQMRITEGKWVCERAFLGALILANKYTNDQNYDHRSWSSASRTFHPREVTRIEREMLNVLQYNLSVRNEHIVSHYDAITARCRHWVATHSPVAPPSTAFRPPLPAYVRDSSCNWSPSGSSSSSASPTESPVLLTPEQYPPFDRTAYQLAAPAVPRCTQALAGGYRDPSSITGSQGAAFSLTHDALFPQSLPALAANEKFFGDATDLDIYASCDVLQQPAMTLPTLPHLAEVIPPTLLHPPAGATYAFDSRYNYAQLPAAAMQETQNDFSTIPHSFGDLTYIW